MKFPRRTQKVAVDAAVEAGARAATGLLAAELPPEEMGKQAADDVVRLVLSQTRELGIELTAKEQTRIERELRQIAKTYRASAERMEELAQGGWLDLVRSSD